MSDSAPTYCLPAGTERLEPSVRPFVMEALRRAGFETADASALAHLESKLDDFLSVLPLFAAQQARTRAPQAHDLVHALTRLGNAYDPHSLQRIKRRSTHNSTFTTSLKSHMQQDEQLPSWAAPDRNFLQVQSAEEEKEAVDDMSLSRKRKRGDEIPEHLPPFPAPHTWSETAAYPMSSSTSLAPLALVERKLASARLVQAALSRLIQQTEAIAAPTPDVPLDEPNASSGAATPQSTSGVGGGGGAIDSTPASAQKPKKLALRLRTSISSASNPALAQLSPLTPAGKEGLSSRSAGTSFMPPPASATLPSLNSSALLPMAGPASAGAGPSTLMMRRKSILLANDEDPWAPHVPRGWPGHGADLTNITSSSSSLSSAPPSGFALTPGTLLHTPGLLNTNLAAGAGIGSAGLNTPALLTPALGTPLPGTPFAYPPTPGDAYASNAWTPMGVGAGAGVGGEGGEVPLPKVVNYRAGAGRRSWKV